MKDEQLKLKQQLTILFWINIFIFVAGTVALVFHKGIFGASLSAGDLAIERFGIILTFGAIPLSLKLFHTMYKKVIETELSVFLQKLKNYFIFRMLALDVVVLLNFVAFYFIGATNFIYMAVLTIFAFLICYPTETLIDPVQEDNITKNDNNNLEL